jgi:hypothetical protein
MWNKDKKRPDVQRFAGKTSLIAVGAEMARSSVTLWPAMAWCALVSRGVLKARFVPLTS